MKSTEFVALGYRYPHPSAAADLATGSRLRPIPKSNATCGTSSTRSAR